MQPLVRWFDSMTGAKSCVTGHNSKPSTNPNQPLSRSLTPPALRRYVRVRSTRVIRGGGRSVAAGHVTIALAHVRVRGGS